MRRGDAEICDLCEPQPLLQDRRVADGVSETLVDAL